MNKVPWDRFEDKPDEEGVGAVRFAIGSAVVVEGEVVLVVGEGSSEQKKLASASTPVELNWTKPGGSRLIMELIQLS